MSFSPRMATWCTAAASVFMASTAMGQTPAAYTDTSTYTDLSRYLHSSQSQNATAEQIGVYLASDAAKPGLDQGRNQSYITQIGNNNRATADTTASTAGSYYNNLTVQTQIGTGNSSTVSAVGSNNLLSTSQVGAGNMVTVEAYGNANTFSTTQTGVGLSYTIQRVGNGQSISVNQTGIGRN